MTEISKKRILITGAALGLGRQLALQFCRHSNHLLLWDILEEELRSLQNEIHQKGGRVEIILGDLRNAEDSERKLKELSSRFKIDILILNAAVVQGLGFEEISSESHQELFQINYFSPLQFIQNLLPDLKQRPEAHIVCIASIAGFVGFPYASSYSASKWALIGAIESLRFELLDQGYKNLKLSLVCPSYIDTGMFDGAKAPKLLPFIKPDRLAKSIVRGIQANRNFHFYPAFLRFVPALRALLPECLWKKLFLSLGVQNGMKTWRGRKESSK